MMAEDKKALDFRIEFSQAEIIFREGEPADSIFYIEKGIVSGIKRIERSGQYESVALKKRGDKQLLGVLNMNSNNPVYPYTAIAANDCVVSRIPIASLKGMFKNEPKLAIVMLAVAFNEIAALTGANARLKAVVEAYEREQSQVDVTGSFDMTLRGHLQQEKDRQR